MVTICKPPPNVGHPGLRRYGTQVWERYRAPFLAAVGEGREQGAFTPTASPDDVVDLVLSALAGATIFRVLHHPACPPAPASAASCSN
jgi:hypothetical protein